MARGPGCGGCWEHCPWGGRDSSERRGSKQMPHSVGLFPGCEVLRMPNPECWGLIKRGQLRVREAGRSEFLEILASGPQTQAQGRSLSLPGRRSQSKVGVGVGVGGGC